ncbi:DsbA family protein [Janibacter cremeus]|uniref:Protein-disulfide isomerase n=1 Tax=Janibacter cremeus TaxID=1285192 RepID=A0A852VSB8_9MICO|nr:thioredoxin domain-containing protein [Janibacter cremeus]NYF98330.1 protein-disulfide isomerase [Janibacter cremeus]
MTGTNRRVLTIVAAVAVVVLLAAGVFLSDRGDDSSESSSGASAGETASEGSMTEEEVGLARRDADDVTAMGDVDAPVVLIEYSDYRCPFCGAFARDTMPVLIEDYIDSGKLRFEWRDFPVFGDESLKGAMAARAAGEQDKYWQYHDAMYQDAPQRGHLDITDEKVMAWAKEADVPDLDQFEQDLDDPQLREKVEADAREASTQVGATGTPTFVIGDQKIVGAQPTDAFRDIIDEELDSVEEG